MIVVVGLSHKTTPIAVRERIAIREDQLSALLTALARRPGVGEALAISTCNRVELVASPSAAPTFAAAFATGATVDGSGSLDQVAAELVAEFESRVPGLTRHLYVHQGAPAVRHLFRVAASLDSLVVGEPQILGQLKDAMMLARQAGTLGRTLNRGVAHAIRTAKRVRTETGLGVGQVSVPSVALDLARQVFGELTDRTVLLVGSGAMAENMTRLMADAGAKLHIIGRNCERVEELARAAGGVPRAWDSLRQALIDADVVITSTRAPSPVITETMVSGIRRARRGRSLLFVDLAVPRDVESTVDQLENVFCYNIDDFSQIVGASLSSRQREADRAERIVEQEVEGFRRWIDTLRVTPTVVALRRRFRGILQEELDRSLRTRLKHLDSKDRDALSVMLDAAVKKLCHGPTAKLRDLAGEREFDAFRALDLAGAVEELFELAEETRAPTSAPPSVPTSTAPLAPHSAGDPERAGDPGQMR